MNITRRKNITSEEVRRNLALRRQKRNELRLSNQNKTLEPKIEKDEVPSPYQIKHSYSGRKPRILLLCDVEGWAWWIKSTYLKKYLSNEFDIDIYNLSKNKIFDKFHYDLYVVFGYGFLSTLEGIPFHKRICGVTAHKQQEAMKHSLKKAYAVFVNSKLLLNEVKTIHEKVFYTPNGVDIEMFSPLEVLKDDEVRFGHIGKLSKFKGQEEIIEQAIQITNAKYFSHYNNHTTKIPYEKMPQLYNNFDVFIVASTEDGTPCPALEAAACGRPIISNKIGNMPELIEDGINGFIVEKNINEYVNKIKWFQENPEKIREMSLNIRKKIEENWSWEKQVENYRYMFKDLLYMSTSVPVSLSIETPTSTTPLIQITSKPKILLLSDVEGWAWDVKAKNIKKHLSDEFDIDIRYFQSVSEKGKMLDKDVKYDIYFTFECGTVKHIHHAPFEKRITGVTSHTYPNLKCDWEGMLKSAAIIHANSMLLYNEILKFHNNVFYVPNGVDETMFSFEERDIESPFVVGYVGKGTVRKGYDAFIVPACREAGVTLKSQVCRFNSINVKKPHEMPNFYKDVDVIIIASDMDGTPNQLLEGAATGRTFIGNRIGNVPEFVKEGINGFMVERRISDYVEKLIWLKENREACAKMGIEARKTVEESWTWKIQAENYRKMFKSMLNA